MQHHVHADKVRAALYAIYKLPHVSVASQRLNTTKDILAIIQAAYGRALLLCPYSTMAPR